MTQRNGMGREEGGGRRVQDGVIWENGIKTCIISYKKWIASPGWMQYTGSLGLVHWDDPEGWYFSNERGERDIVVTARLR